MTNLSREQIREALWEAFDDIVQADYPEGQGPPGDREALNLALDAVWDDFALFPATPATPSPQATVTVSAEQVEAASVAIALRMGMGAGTSDDLARVAFEAANLPVEGGERGE